MRTNPDGTHDYPFDQVTDTVIEELQKNPNLRFFQKFTCAKCGNRLTIDVPNKFFKEGECDKCHTITNIKEQGCNYMMFMAVNKEHADIFDTIVKRASEKKDG